jgi:hypothetical protein
MPPSFWRSFAMLALLAVGPRAGADQTGHPAEPEPAPVTVAIGLKAGVIPPVLVVPEIVLHAPHLFVGAFGIFIGGGSLDGARATYGGELGYEFNQPGKSTPYLSGAVFRYETWPDATGWYERIGLLALTAGYEWKLKHLDLQLGGGALIVVSHETAPPSCPGLCFDLRGLWPPLMPAIDLAARFRF